MNRSTRLTGKRSTRWRAPILAGVCASLVLLVGACRSVPRSAPPSSADMFAAQFDLLWSRFDRTYPSFDLKRVDWNLMRATYRPLALASRSQDEFIAHVRDMLDPLHDLHAWLVDPRGQIVPTYRPSAIPNFDQARWQQALRGADYVSHGNGWGEGNVGGYGYLFIGSWNLGAADVNALDMAMLRFKDLPGLIIDVRPNAGGSDAPAYALVGRFTTQPFVASYLQVRTGSAHNDLSAPEARTIAPRGAWQYTRQVIVIAGRGGFSANESFVAAMRALPQVTIIGDTTGGASGNPATFSLGDGWQFTVPRWIEFGPDHRPIEGHGVPPNIPIPWSPMLYAADRDPLIDAAVGILGERNGVYRIAPGNGPGDYGMGNDSGTALSAARPKAPANTPLKTTRNRPIR